MTLESRIFRAEFNWIRLPKHFLTKAVFFSAGTHEEVIFKQFFEIAKSVGIDFSYVSIDKLADTKNKNSFSNNNGVVGLCLSLTRE